MHLNYFWLQNLYLPGCVFTKKIPQSQAKVGKRDASEFVICTKLAFLPWTISIRGRFDAFIGKGSVLSTPEQRKKPSYFPLYWCFNGDPYFMVYEIIPI